jgi:predicted Zn-dependent protease
MKLLLTICLLFAVTDPAALAQPASIREYEQSFPTYPFSDPSPIPLTTAVYPYFRYDGFSTTSIDKKWKVVALENQYIRLLILPEIGGKIWAAIEKKTDRPFLYYNHTVKFRDIAMRGPWTSGGLEANYGIIGHTPNCATPVDYTTKTNEDGSVSCFIGALDLLTRSNWRVEIRLPEDKAFFTTQSFWYNTTPLDQPYYHWMNAGLPAGDDLEFIYPGNKYLGHNGEYSSWPINPANGKKVSFYRNNDFGGYKSYHVFGKYTDFAGAYWHNQGLGMVRYGTHDDKAGKKIWIWGLSRQGMIWDHLLTDTDGQYVELQSGRLFNQNTEKSSLTPFKHQAFAPYETDTWKEYWYPVIGTRGFVSATEYGALNILTENHQLKIYFSPAQALTDTLRITVGGKTIYQRRINCAPLQLFADSIPLSDTPDNLVATLGSQKLSWSSSPSAGDLARPVNAPGDFDWTSPYGHYLAACEAMDQKNYPAAELYLDSSLQKDKHFLPSLVKKAELFYRNLRYTEALELAKHALSINTVDGGANFIYGLINMQLGNNTDAADGFDIASLNPTWRSAAYTCLARLYLKQDNLSRAAVAAAKALTAQPQNIDALQLQALIARLENNRPLHEQSLKTILAYDPLNHFARYEQQGAAFTIGIQNELPRETFLELAIWYANNNQTTDAIGIIQLSPSVAETRIWLAWLTHQQLDTAALDPVRAFPFRSETAAVIQALLTAYPDSWFLRYQLALIYKDRNRTIEAKQLLDACGDQPSFAPFYAFRAALATPNSARHDLEHAFSLDSSWRYTKLLAEFELKQSNPTRANQLAGTFYSTHPKNYIMGTLYAKTLLANQQYAACVQLLRHLTIIPFEGANEGRELYREALLMQAITSIRQQQYKKALNFIGEAKKWPENLGVGQPYAEDEDLHVENQLSYRCYKALHQDIEAAALRQRIDNYPNTAAPASTQAASDARLLAALLRP